MIWQWTGKSLVAMRAVQQGLLVGWICHTFDVKMGFSTKNWTSQVKHCTMASNFWFWETVLAWYVKICTRDKSSWHDYFVKKSVDESALRDGFPDNFECSLFRFRRKYVQRRRWNFLEIILHPFEFWRLVWYIKVKYLFNLYFESLVCFLFFYQRISLPFFFFCILRHRSWLFHSIPV